MDTVHEEALAAAGVRADGTIDINAALRALLEGLLNAVMDEQASELGAPRNGYRERSLDTCVGRVTLRIPKLREGTYFPEDVVARWSRTDTALASAVRDMWAAGVSTRKVEAVASDLGLESMSRSRVSRLCEGLDGEVAEMRGADLSSDRWPYLWLDATYVPCREAGAPRSVAMDITLPSGAAMCAIRRLYCSPTEHRGHGRQRKGAHASTSASTHSSRNAKNRPADI